MENFLEEVMSVLRCEGCGRNGWRKLAKVMAFFWNYKYLGSILMVKRRQIIKDFVW